MATRKYLDIDIREHFNSVRDMYATSASKNTVNILLLGDAGSGKTYSLRTARGPVLIHSFDPGGSKGLKEDVEKGRVIVDSRFEEEDPMNPTAFRAWEEEFRKLYNSGVFDHVGTYVIDSLTMFSQALMNAVLAANGRAPDDKSVKLFSKDNALGIPQLRDYQIQMTTVAQQLGICASLPCDFVLTSHLEYKQDETTGKILALPMVTGKLAQKLPQLFDEIYVMNVKTMSNSNEYRFLTEPDGMLKGRTRMGSGGKFERFEPADFKKLLKKAGFDTEDKPLFK